MKSNKNLRYLTQGKEVKQFLPRVNRKLLAEMTIYWPIQFSSALRVLQTTQGQKLDPIYCSLNEAKCLSSTRVSDYTWLASLV
jgi:hypothetical protein